MTDLIPPEEISKLRAMLIDQVEKADPDGTAEVALSGGTDSATVLFAALASGRRPRCMTFHVEGNVSEDLQAARRITSHFGLELSEITIPWNEEQLVKDIRYLVSKAHVIKKTVIQCMHPWLYIYPAMRSGTILSGLGADDYYCSDKRAAIHLHKGGEARLLEYGYRVSDSKNLNYSDGNSIAFAATFGKQNIDIYGRQDIEDWFKQWKIKQLHAPVQKYPSLKAFEEYFTQGAFRRLQSPYQINSGLRDYHETLLTSKYNTRGLQDMIGIYTDIAKGVI